ncbi:DUF4255 domain-containing protein [Massilia horti]|uniref:DUF4255 domain-containing protein n=1 Tax=Massilia horti TaxID=2562153 RepID=A0A4Y9SYB8_9BURK|nr:DUF4255 domain-containing protein [Massilia horti]TFW31737.1 DUF4255 domain-containing protein [Massilia horti]
MSDARAIAAVTATMRHLLTKPVQDLLGNLSDLLVSSQPLDLARKGETRPAQINIFLYQHMVNAAWRNNDMPRQALPGETAFPPLALNLHYLVTAYGRGDNDNDDSAASQLLIGGAMSVLHDNPLLGRQDIRDALLDSDLADQFERIRITPLALTVEDLSKMWTAFQAPYRISAAYECAVVLIDSKRAGRAPLPVLRRGQQDQGVDAVTRGAPVLRAVRPPLRQGAARLGEAVFLDGDNLLGGDTFVRFSSLIPPLSNAVPMPKPPPLVELGPLQADADGAVTVVLPDLAQDPDAFEKWAPGSYAVSAIARPPDRPALQSQAAVAFALAPAITLTPNNTTAASVAAGDTLTVRCAPRLRANQDVRVLFGEREVRELAITQPDPASPAFKQSPTVITFAVPAVPKGVYLVRLRVDGIDSIPVITPGDPPLPGFDPEQQVTV